MSDKRPAFQWYPKDYISDENVVLMTLEERGAYVHLLCHCWLEGSIPADGNRMARLCGTDSNRMAELWLAIEPCFQQHPRKPGRLVNQRLNKERKKQDEYRKKRAEAGKAGADARWKKDES